MPSTHFQVWARDSTINISSISCLPRRSGRSYWGQSCQKNVLYLYEVAYEKAHPFDKLVEGMLHLEMVGETAALMQTGIEESVQMNIVINNRAGGNAPLIARRVTERFIETYGIVRETTRSGRYRLNSR